MQDNIIIENIEFTEEIYKEALKENKFEDDNLHIVQAIPFNRNSWNATDGGNGDGNRKGIAIEISKPIDNNIESGSDESVRIYQNGSTSENVYADANCTIKIGSLTPREKCDCFGIFNDRAMVRYAVDGTNNYKIGFCKWIDGVK